MKKTSLLILLLFLLVVAPVSAARPTPTPTPIQTKSVCLDPGHGGSDSGAVYLDLTEKDTNLAVALSLRDKLVAAGYTVYLTRTTDVTLSNADRYNYCNSTGASILVSVHQNGSSNKTIDYTEALYGNRNQDKPLAIVIANTVSQSLGLPNNGVVNFASGVLLKSTMPSAISEALFVTSEAEYSGIKSGVRIDQESSALLSAIQTYFGN